MVKIKSLADQVKILHEIFPELFPELKDATYDSGLSKESLPAGAEGWFAIPRWQLIAETYNEAVKKILLLTKQHNEYFENRFESFLGPQYLSPDKKTRLFWETIDDSQKKDNKILVVPAQFGARHKGKSVKDLDSAFEKKDPQEFGLGIFAVAITLLTHPERLKIINDIWIKCPGDRYFRHGDKKFPYVPYFNCIGLVNLCICPIESNSELCGSATGFLPTSLWKKMFSLSIMTIGRDGKGARAYKN